MGAVVLDQRTLSRRVRQLAREINRDYRGQELLVVSILKGAFVFTCDLMRQLRIPLILDFISISRYDRRPRRGEVTILNDLGHDVKDRNVLLVEDIVDTGMTLNYLVARLSTRGPASLAVCTLLDRPDLRLATIPIRYVGFNVSSDFLIGYGLDYHDQFRNLPFVATLNPGRLRLRQD